jgi:hypothetical protein
MENKITIMENPPIENKDRISGIRLFFLMLFLMGQLAGAPAQNPERMANQYRHQLVRVFEYRDSLEGVHPFVKGLYPIAIAEDDHFYVFDLDETGRQYRLMAHQEIEMKIPKGLRAAFPQQFYDNKCACVVTGDVFDTPAGYVTIFHEFVHCHQWHTVEPALRQQLPLAQEALQKEDYMWEMTHPFPYTDSWFESTYSKLQVAARDKDLQAVTAIRKELAEILNPDDYQYMVWQEWKEGYALFIENKLRQHLQLPINQVGRRTPFSRTAFYAGGEAMISLLVEQDPELQNNLEDLFYRLHQ